MKKKMSHSLMTNLLFAAIVIALIAAVFLLNAILLVLSNRYPLNVDLTSNAAYEIGDETKLLLRSLDEPVEIYVLTTEDRLTRNSYYDQARRVLGQFVLYSDNVTVTYVDTAADPTFAAGYPELSLNEADLIVRSGDKYRHMLFANLFHYNVVDGSLVIAASRAEEAVASAIVSVTSDRVVRIALLTGHGETDVSSFANILIDNNYEVHSVNLTTTPSLDEYDAAMLMAPTADLSEEALRKLDAWLYNDGDYGRVLLYAASPAQTALPNLDAFLSEWGIAFTEGAIFETKADMTVQYQPYYPIVEYGQNKYTDMLKDSSMPLVMPLSRPMEVLFTAKNGYYVETLLNFSATSGVRPADAGADFTADDATRHGPMPALVVSTFTATGGSSGVIAVSSVDVFNGDMLYSASYSNLEYMLNLLGDKTERSDIINIEPKSLSGKTLNITGRQVVTLMVVLVFVLPLLLLGCGVLVWLRRRNK